MQTTDIPPKFNIPFAQQALTPTYRRPVPQVPSSGFGGASIEQGFPPIDFLPTAAGGFGVPGNDTNGVLYQMCNLLIWLMMGGPVYFDSDFSAAIGGYPLGAVLSASPASANTSVGDYWISLIDDNTYDPDATDGMAPVGVVFGVQEGVQQQLVGKPGLAGGFGTTVPGTGVFIVTRSLEVINGATKVWAKFSVLDAAQTTTTGDCHWRPTDETLQGYVRLNALTIGDASSNATERANADCLKLFTWLWTNFTDAQCPIFTSGGGASSRGATAAADWAAHKAISTPDMRGAWPAGLDTMGNASAGRLNNATFDIGGGTVAGSRGHYLGPISGDNNASAPFQAGTWYVKL